MKKFKENFINALKMGLKMMGCASQCFQFNLPWTTVHDRKENTKNQIGIHDKKSQQYLNRRHGKNRV